MDELELISRSEALQLEKQRFALLVARRELAIQLVDAVIRLGEAEHTGSGNADGKL